MKYMIVFLIPALLLLLTSCNKEIAIPKPDLPDDVNYSNHPQHAEYQAQLEAYRQKSQSPGALLLIHRQGEPLWIGAAGMSNLEHQVLMQTNTPFRVGSITKIFVATAIMRLVELDKLGLGDPLSLRLPSIIGKIPNADKITIRHLLGHLSGIVDPPNESKRYQTDLVDDPERIDAMSLERLMQEYVYGKPLHFQPGEAYSYSNTNYWLLGQIIERITGKTVQQVLDNLIFTPLELQNTYLDQRDDKNVARGYADLYGDGRLLDVSRWDRADTDGKPDGGIISTAHDLMIFIQALMEGRIVSSDSVEQMKKIQLETCDNTFCEYGLGLEIWRTGAGLGFGHNGGSVGIEANLLFFSDAGNIVVIYKNNGNGSDKSFLDALMN